MDFFHLSKSAPPRLPSARKRKKNQDQRPLAAETLALHSSSLAVQRSPEKWSEASEAITAIKTAPAVSYHDNQTYRLREMHYLENIGVLRDYRIPGILVIVESCLR